MKYYGLDTVNVEENSIISTGEYAITNRYDFVEKAIKEYIIDSLWAFRTSFLANYINLPSDVIQRLQEEAPADCNQIFLKLLDDKIDDLVKDATGLDGEGHFLSPYDGEMIEIEITDEIKKIIPVKALLKGDVLYLFRLN